MDTNLVSLRTLSPDPISEVVATPPIAAAGVLQAEDSGSPAASQLFPAFFPIPPSLSSPAGPPPARAVAKWQKTFSTVVTVLAPVHKSTQATESIVHDLCAGAKTPTNTDNYPNSTLEKTPIRSKDVQEC